MKNNEKEKLYKYFVQAGLSEQQKVDEVKQLKAMHERMKLDEEKDIKEKEARSQVIFFLSPIKNSQRWQQRKC